MNDGYLILSQPQYITREVTKTVHEHRAPTDESIKIYKEMVDKAEKSILDVFVISDNILNGSIAVLRNAETMGIDVIYRFILNGNRLEGSIKTEYREMIRSREEVIRVVYEKLSKKIAAHLFDTLDTESIRSFGER